MPLLEQATPQLMTRVAIVAPAPRLRRVLVDVADSGLVELERPRTLEGLEIEEALRRAEHAHPGQASDTRRLAVSAPDIHQLEDGARWDLLAGEASLARRAATAVSHRSVVALLGWMPEHNIATLAQRLAALGTAVVPMPRPAWGDPPTALPRPPGAEGFRALVDTYGTARYADLDPTPFAAAAFVLMFGMMFGDVGDGLLLVCLALYVRYGGNRRLATLRKVTPLVMAAGLMAAVFGAAYGEFFGPTGLLRPLWLQPLEEPLRLLQAGVALGAALLGVSYMIGFINRWRETGPQAALLDSSGGGGLALFAGMAVAVAGIGIGARPVLVAGLGLAGTGLLLVFAGLLRHGSGGATGVIEATVELFDIVIRLGTNAVSFARLAAFGMVHAALGAVVWTLTTNFRGGGAMLLAAGAIFVVGHTVAFLLEVLVAGVQALRLEYYELFSRVFSGEGRRFSPWHIPMASAEEL